MALWQDLIVCNGPDCTFGDLIKLVKAVITDLTIISTYIAVAVCIYAGFILVTAGFRGDSGALTKAKKMFGAVVKGYIVIFAAWLIVYTILNALTGSGGLLSGPTS